MLSKNALITCKLIQNTTSLYVWLRWWLRNLDIWIVWRSRRAAVVLTHYLKIDKEGGTSEWVSERWGDLLQYNFSFSPFRWEFFTAKNNDSVNIVDLLAHFKSRQQPSYRVQRTLLGAIIKSKKRERKRSEQRCRTSEKTIMSGLKDLFEAACLVSIHIGKKSLLHKV